MKRTALALTIAMILPSASLFAQAGDAIEYSASGCIRAGKEPLMLMNVGPKGELRGYFRRVNTTDWCSVEGKNMGPLSNVVLPKFEVGDEIEYFFVVIEGKRVKAKSPRVYRAKATDGCESDVARHMMEINVDCSRVTDIIPAALGSAYSVPLGVPEPDVSPSNPTAQARSRQ